MDSTSHRRNFGIFLSTPSARRATSLHPAMMVCSLISIHALREEGDAFCSCACRCVIISIHALREEGDCVRSLSRQSKRAFLSTPSARRATRHLRDCAGDFRISIHALREEGDQKPSRDRNQAGNFYPRPPRGGRRFPYRDLIIAQKFLSTPSARRATHAYKDYASIISNFYPRPPRGGRPALS